MAGFITKDHLADVAETYGEEVAQRMLATDQPTFLMFLVSEGLL